MTHILIHLYFISNMAVIGKKSVPMKNNPLNRHIDSKRV